MEQEPWVITGEAALSEDEWGTVSSYEIVWTAVQGFTYSSQELNNRQPPSRTEKQDSAVGF